MQIVFRVDSATFIGSGHIMRCLTLANKLKLKGAKTSFICRDFEGNLGDKVKEAGHDLYILPVEGIEITKEIRINHKKWLGVPISKDANQTEDILNKLPVRVDWVVTDIYAINDVWHSKIRKYSEHIMAIHDLADCKLDCDLLLDQNFGDDKKISRYDELITGPCEKLIGPQYAILRDEFVNLRDKTYKLRKKDRLLIFMGSSDQHNVTSEILKAIGKIDEDVFKIDVIVGNQNVHRKEVKSLCDKMANVNYHYDINADNMALLMASASLAIGAGGTSTYERCCLGLPSIVIPVAQNQLLIKEAIESIPFASYLGYFKEVNADDIVNRINDLRTNPYRAHRMRQLSMNLVDGRGADRVANEMFSM
jgi:UDP-2,4-diacetamido-2,4,6-trideoxy-beta-L-altropyranose hydrolase